MLTILALLTAYSGPPGNCTVDRASLLMLDEQTFDQDMTGGWRILGNRGCYVEAADLIRDWREAHGPALSRAWLSFWHEGQLRATAGQTRAAIALFGRSRRPTKDDRIGWNHYVDGSIAFLRRDRRRFEAARARLTALSRPAGPGPDGTPVTHAWPVNLDVLDGFRRCWNQPYEKAYGKTCRTPVTASGK